MQFKYNEIKALKEQYDEIAAQISNKSLFVYHKILNITGGHVCDGLGFETDNNGTVFIKQNIWDGYDGESSPNGHVAYPFRWLNMSPEDIGQEYANNMTLAYCGEGICL